MTTHRKKHRVHSARANSGRGIFLLLGTFLLVAALMVLTPHRAPFSSSEVRFTDASASGLQIVPASCPSDPHYSGECSEPPRAPIATITTDASNIQTGQSTTIRATFTAAPGTSGPSDTLTHTNINPVAGLPATVSSIIYQAETGLSHAIGRLDADGWSASTALDSANYLSYGPYATTWGGGDVSADFILMVDNNSADNQTVVTLDIVDATTGTVLATRDVTRREFKGVMTYQQFVLQTSLSGRSGHAMEARVHWKDRAYIRLDKIDISTSPGGYGDTDSSASSRTYTFVPTTAGTYVFYASAQTSYYTRWAVYDAVTVTVTSADPCPLSAPASEDGLGYKVNTPTGWQRINRNGVSFCVSNSGAANYFAPANTANEMQLFKNAVPRLPGVSVQ